VVSTSSTDVPGLTDVVVGVIVKPHGVRGAVVVESHSDEPKRFAIGSTVFAGDEKRCLTVRTARPQGGRLVVEFDQITTRNAAESLVGHTLTATVPADGRPDDDAEFFDRHLVGLVAQLPDGKQVGRIVDVMHGVAQDILVVATPTGERLVPFVEALVPSVDLAAGRVTIADMPGLLEDDE